MKHSFRLNQRIQEIGEDILERAADAAPRFWQEAWWSERMIQALDSNERLRTRAFEFVECLPALRTNDAMIEHIAEYFGGADDVLPENLARLLRNMPVRNALKDVVGPVARFGATRMASRFITGYDERSVVKTIERLRRQGMTCTLDVLGEFTSSDAQADRYAQVYHDLIDRLTPHMRTWTAEPRIDRDPHGLMPLLNLSVKLTSLDPYFDAIDPARAIERVGRRLRPLLQHARRRGAFVNIDLESFKYRDLTFALFKQILSEPEFADWPDVGIVVQAYLKDGEQDLADLLEWGRHRRARFAVRLVKGAYWDAETAAAVRAHKQPPVWTRKWETDACFERMTRTMLEHRDVIRPCIASHNVRSIAVALATAEEMGVPTSAYELQMLYGMGDPLKSAVVEMDQCLRVYCPYGDLVPGMGYLIRRLLENTSNEGFLKQVGRNGGARNVHLADPAVARPPSAPLPQRFYQNTDPEEPMSNFTNASNTNFADETNRRKMRGAIEYVRGEFGREYPSIINGESVATGDWFNTFNPSARQEIVGRVASSTQTEAQRAVDAAVEAFPTWRLTRAHDRAAMLRDVADKMEMRRFELAATMVLEVGKPWREADADVTEAVDHCRYYADQIERMEYRPRIRNIPGENNVLIYVPKGVCAVIAPWAFPLAILTGMTSAALAGGNAVVIKPARQASVLASKFVEILHDASVPKAVANLVTGPGEVVGQYLVRNPAVSIVSFTGSYAVGRTVLEEGNRTSDQQAFMRKMIVEMGGKNAIIVDDDADLDGAVVASMESAFSFAGQKCSSCSRLIVLESVYGEFVDRLKKAVDCLPIGPAEEPSTVVGPVIDDEAVQRIEAYVVLGRKEGHVVQQTELPDHCRAGYFVPPTILAGVAPDSRIAQEEIFGPVVVVLRAADFDEALAIANGTRYALTGGVFSRSPGHIDRARREFAVGNLYINRRITGSQVDAQPFGGFRLSGTGVKAGSPDYITHFMDSRCVTENTLRSGLVPDAEQVDVERG